MGRYAEINELDSRPFSQQYIVALHVPMHAMIVVQVYQGLDGLTKNVSYLLILQATVSLLEALNQIGNGTSGAEL